MSTTDRETTLIQRQKLRRGKLAALYKHLKVTGNPDLAFLDRFRLTKDPEKGTTILGFYKGDKNWWVSLTKQTGIFNVANTRKRIFSEVGPMKNLIGIDKTLPDTEGSIEAATKLSRDIKVKSMLLMELPSLVKDVHAKSK